jgi:hypothetical protein
LGEGLDRLADAMNALTPTALFQMLDPIHKVLAKAADALDRLGGTGRMAPKDSTMASLEGIAKSLDLQSLGLDPAALAAQAAGPIFATAGPAPPQDKSALWEIVTMLEAYARLSKQGPNTYANIRTAKKELPEADRKDPAKVKARFIRNTTPPRPGETPEQLEETARKAEEEQDKALRDAREKTKGMEDRIHQEWLKAKEESKKRYPGNELQEEFREACRKNRPPERRGECDRP